MQWCNEHYKLVQDDGETLFGRGTSSVSIGVLCHCVSFRIEEHCFPNGNALILPIFLTDRWQCPIPNTVNVTERDACAAAPRGRSNHDSAAGWICQSAVWCSRWSTSISQCSSLLPVVSWYSLPSMLMYVTKYRQQNIFWKGFVDAKASFKTTNDRNVQPRAYRCSDVKQIMRVGFALVIGAHDQSQEVSNIVCS